MGKLVYLDNLTRIDLPPERVLEGAIKADLAGVVILGYDTDGKEYFASSYADGGTVCWLMDRCKHMLMTVEGANDQ